MSKSVPPRPTSVIVSFTSAFVLFQSTKGSNVPSNSKTTQFSSNNNSFYIKDFKRYLQEDVDLTFCDDPELCTVDGFCDCFNSGQTADCSPEIIIQACFENAIFTCGPPELEALCATCATALAQLIPEEVCLGCSALSCCASGLEGTGTCLQGLLPNGTIPDLGFCPDGTCSLSGFCDCFTNEEGFESCDANILADACDTNTIFDCGPPRFQEVCAFYCDEEYADILESLIPPHFCEACALGTCCSAEGGSSATCLEQPVSLSPSISSRPEAPPSPTFSPHPTTSFDVESESSQPSLSPSKTTPKPSEAPKPSAANSHPVTNCLSVWIAISILLFSILSLFL